MRGMNILDSGCVKNSNVFVCWSLLKLGISVLNYKIFVCIVGVLFV